MTASLAAMFVAAPILLLYGAMQTAPPSVTEEHNQDTARAFYYFNGTAMVNSTTVAITLAFYSVIALGIYSLMANAAAEQMVSFIETETAINATAQVIKAAADIFIGGAQIVGKIDNDVFEDEDEDDDEARYQREYQTYLRSYKKWAKKYGGNPMPPPPPPTSKRRLGKR
jgi:hypothetical protein